jgi:DNA-binding CsgD family transcriptional regulator
VGPPGIGKSSLLEAAAEHVAAGWTVLRVVGVEAERELPFAGLFTLMQPMLAHEAALTPAQAEAIRVALGRESGSPPGRIVLGGALLALLAGFAERRRVLILVDDFQWVDTSSAEAIAFVARRLGAEPVAMLIGSRAAESDHRGCSGPLLRSLKGLHLDSLDAGAVARLLPDVSPRVAHVLAERTGGNPLAALEAARYLDVEVRDGRRALPQLLPFVSALDTYRAQLRAMPDEVQRAGVVLAAAGRADGAVIASALDALDLSSSDVEPLEELGLAWLDARGVRWRHPLVRAAALRGGSERVRQAHQVLAKVWATRPGGQSSSVWHAAAAALGPDRHVAEGLARVAEIAASRDASLEAADAWERAAELHDDSERSAVWLALAGKAAGRGGNACRAAYLMDRSVEHSSPTSPGWLLHERGRLEHVLGHPTRAFSFLMSAARAAEGHQVWAAAEASLAAMYAARPDLALVAAAEATARHDPADPVQRFFALHAQGAAAALNGDQSTARSRISQALRLSRERGLLRREPDMLLWVINAPLFLDGPPSPLDTDAVECLAQRRASGELVWSPRTVRLAAFYALARGAWTTAYADFVDATELARLAGQRTQVAEGLLASAFIEAARGVRDDCLAHTQEAGEIVADLEVRWLADSVWQLRGLLFMTIGDYQESARCYGRALGMDPWALPGLVESLLADGHRPEAASYVRDARDEMGTAAYAIAEALLVNDGESAARQILDRVDESQTTFEAAHCRLLAGQRLRTAGARRAARTQLRAAEEVFGLLGTTHWLQRTRDQLKASGATLRKEPTGDQLTPSELRVATLVAQGVSNKDAAAMLFISPKTVEFHLGRVFRKLEVTNRTTLAARLSTAGNAREIPGA